MVFMLTVDFMMRNVISYGKEYGGVWLKGHNSCECFRLDLLGERLEAKV